MISRRRVVVLPSEYPDASDPLQFNGNWAREQTLALASRHDVAVVFPTLAGAGRAGLFDDRDGDLRTVRVRYRHVRKTWAASYVFAAWRGFSHVRGDLWPDLIHAHGLYPGGFAGVHLAHLYRLPLVVTEHWGRIAERARGSALVRFALRQTLRRATRIVAVSSALATELTAFETGCRPVVVPNVVSTLFFQHRSDPAGDGNCMAPTRFLFVGSLRDGRKGLGELLEGLRLYRDSPRARSFELTVIGEGELRPALEALASRLGLAGACTFLGARSREQVAEAMHACDIFAMPSRYETFGVVFAEALACGKPVLAGEGTAAEEIVPRWAGVFVRPGDPSSIATGLAEIATMSDRSPAARVRAYAEEQFSPAAVAAAVSDVYESALAAG